MRFELVELVLGVAAAGAFLAAVHAATSTPPRVEIFPAALAFQLLIGYLIIRRRRARAARKLDGDEAASSSTLSDP